jgi:hypothetical protein
LSSIQDSLPWATWAVARANVILLLFSKVLTCRKNLVIRAFKLHVKTC